MKRVILSLILCLSLPAMAQNWEHVCNSGEYYYGEGVATVGEDAAKAETEASNAAMSNLINSIVVHVKNDFKMLDKETDINGEISHESHVRSCIQTYSQGKLTNVGTMAPVRKGKEIIVRHFIKKTELKRIFDNRISKAKDFIAMADQALQKKKIDMALQYYYWAYTLLCTLQFPEEVKGTDGKALVNTLPLKIESILNKIDVKCEKREGDFVDLLFKYDGQDIESLDFTYSDGRAECKGIAKNGRGMIEMIPGYSSHIYHLDIEYQYIEQAQGDYEMESVLGVVAPKAMKHVSVTVQGKGGGAAAKNNAQIAKAATPAPSKNANTSAQQASQDKPQPEASQLVVNPAAYDDIMSQVLAAICEKRHSSITSLFTLDGLDRFNRLIKYGSGRIVGTPEIHYFKGLDNTVVARGLQMSFSFKTGTKKTFVEDVIFTFDENRKIDNITFGMGKRAEEDILYKNGSGWSNQRKEILMEFMENYKTAYCLKDLEFIKSIFADDATIIIGKVLKKLAHVNPTQEYSLSVDGQKIIVNNRVTKDQYIKNLRQCFAKNEFINLRFSNNTVQYLEKIKEEKDRDYFAIQIGQEYNSSTYADKGYLFLLVDMTNHKEPVIHVRTWQPNEVDINKVYNIGDLKNY